MAQLDLDQCAQNEHSDRWNKVDNPAKRTPPDDDDDQPTLKQIVAINIGRKCIIALRKKPKKTDFSQLHVKKPKWAYQRPSKAPWMGHGFSTHWTAPKR